MVILGSVGALGCSVEGRPAAAGATGLIVVEEWLAGPTAHWPFLLGLLLVATLAGQRP